MISICSNTKVVYLQLNPLRKGLSYKLRLRKFSKDIPTELWKEILSILNKNCFIEYNLFCVIKFIYASTTANYFEKGLACNINSLKLK